MNKNRVSGCSRRSFLHSISPVVVGAMGAPCLARRLQSQQLPGFWSEFSPEEQSVIDNSVMAQDILNFAGHGYGCAECSYAVGLRYLGVLAARSVDHRHETNESGVCKVEFCSYLYTITSGR